MTAAITIVASAGAFLVGAVLGFAVGVVWATLPPPPEADE